MIETFCLQPGITLRCFTDQRFKQSCLSLQLIRPMRPEEAALNALIPAVLLRGTESAPDLRAITLRLDDLYGASVGALVRRIGDYQTTGLYCSFISDRYTMQGDTVLSPAITFFGQLFFQPVTENGIFRKDYVQSEKKNLIATIEAQRNDKRTYAGGQLLKKMCSQDTFGIPRLGEAAQAKPISARRAYDHYRKILRQSPIELFYVGDAPPEQIARQLETLFAPLERDYVNLPAQTPFLDPPGGSHSETMDVTQGKLAMGFVTPITIRDPEFSAMQVCNMLFGGGMTSLLFMNIREKLSLCYDISSGYHGSKGILTVLAGIDCAQFDTVCQQVQAQLDLCRTGDFSDDALNAAKQAVISSLLGTHDSPGAIESYYATSALSGLNMTPQQYMESVAQVTRQQVCAAAQSLSLHTTYFLKGVG